MIGKNINGMSAMAHYKRWLSDYFIEQLQGDYSFLINCNKKGDRYRYDVQFRPKDTIMIYFGGTCLLTVTCDEKNKQINFSSDSYSKEHSVEFNKILGVMSPPQRKTACFNFLKRASENASPKWNEVGSEGYWEQRISKLWGGPAWQEYMEMVVIDRQAVISFTDNNEKKIFYDKIKEKYLGVAKQLSSKNR